MKKKYLLLLMILLSYITTLAEPLNIFSNDKDIEIYINKKFIAIQQLINYDLPAGSYLLEIKKGDNLLQSEVIFIEKDQTKTISLDNFVKAESVIIDTSSMEPEVNRALKSKGKIGLGFNLGSLSGISIKYRLNKKFGLEATGFYDQKENEHTYSTYEIRTFYYLKDKIFIKMPASLYLSAGYGERSNNYSESEDNTTNNTNYKKHIDILIGTELSFAAAKASPWFWLHPFIGAMTHISTLDNVYLNFDIGYGQSTNKDTSELNETFDRKGIIGRFGMKFYF